jgi:pheromone shutdown-related protein TraB
MNGTVRRLALRDREFILVGTAHVSRESVDEVARVIQEEHPDRVCVEMDEGRLRAMRDSASWEKLDIVKVLKDGRGFLLMANLALSSFQRRLGAGLGVKPGDEMKRAVDVADEMGIAWSLCDREVQLTLKRAWSRCGFWSKNKLIAALLSSALSNEKLEEGQIESLKNQNELDGMMAELAAYLPAVKETLIDERDRYLATRIYLSEGKKLVAVIGAGHMEGVVARLAELDAGTLNTDLDELEKVPPPGLFARAAPWLIPALIVALIIAGFFYAGADISLSMLLRWALWNGSLAALGAALAFGHPLAILTAFFGAPVATINPLVGVGLFAGVAQATVRKPQVKDLEFLGTDVTSIKGFYRNRITRTLLVFFLSSMGGMIGNFISIPYITSLMVK